MPENVPVKVWLKDLDFPVILVKQVFIKKDPPVQASRYQTALLYPPINSPPSVKNYGAWRNPIRVSGRMPTATTCISNANGFFIQYPGTYFEKTGQAEYCTE
jgi:hypothetical protein